MLIINSLMLRAQLNIMGKSYFIDISVKKREVDKINQWWDDKYKNLGKYSINPFLGEQCTTTVRMSLEESTGIFDGFTFKDLQGLAKPIHQMFYESIPAQTPRGLLGWLLENARHTARYKEGNDEYKKGDYVKITREYPELIKKEDGEIIEYNESQKKTNN